MTWIPCPPIPWGGILLAWWGLLATLPPPPRLPMECLEEWEECQGPHLPLTIPTDTHNQCHLLIMQGDPWSILDLPLPLLTLGGPWGHQGPPPLHMVVGLRGGPSLPPYHLLPI
jgi:hypothetical protein